MLGGKSNPGSYGIITKYKLNVSLLYDKYYKKTYKVLILWNFDINTLQNDGAQELIFDFVGDSGDIDINQISGTCAQTAGVGCSTPNAVINLDITSDNATIQINQKDAPGDS